MVDRDDSNRLRVPPQLSAHLKKLRAQLKGVSLPRIPRLPPYPPEITEVVARALEVRQELARLTGELTRLETWLRDEGVWLPPEQHHESPVVTVPPSEPLPPPPDRESSTATMEVTYDLIREEAADLMKARPTLRLKELGNELANVLSAKYGDTSRKPGTLENIARDTWRKHYRS